MNVNGGAHAQSQGRGGPAVNAGGSSITTPSYQTNGVSELGSSKGGGAPATAGAMPPPSSLPTPAAVKSEKAQGKARQVDEPNSMQWLPTNGSSHPVSYDDTPPEALLSELLPQTENLVPLAAIVERMSNYGYEALQILSETMSSLPSDQRREKIFMTAVTVQRQIAKLVALALWSRLSGDLQKARDTVGLLCEQFAQAEDAVKELTSIRTMLPHSRLRNFDLISAMDVLRTGAYIRLPSTIKTSAMHETPMDDKAVDELVEELEDAIRLRLSCHDILPLQMSDYRIADGRAHFDVPNLFEASLTVDGPFPSGRWYLLTIKFHFRVTGTGKDHFPRVPKKHFRDMLLEQVNAELAPPPPPPLPPEADPTDAQDDAASSGQPPPLVKFFRHLESRALQYQLDILGFQAGELGHGTWKGHLAVERDSQTQALRLTYWSQLRSKADTARSGRLAAAQSWRNGGSITVSIETDQGNKCTARSIAQVLFGGAEVDDVDSLYRKRLAVDWRVDKSIKEGSRQSFTVDVHALNIRTLLLDVVSAHAHAILDNLRSKILRSSLLLGVGDDDCTLRLAQVEGEKDSFPRLRVKLCGAMSLCIALHAVSGQISIEEDVIRVPDAFLSSETGTKADAAIFAQSTERLNRDPDQVVEVLQALRQYAICKDLEQKACFLGLEAVQRLPFQPNEYGKLEAPPEAVLFLSLPQCPHWYLAAQFSAHPPRLALLSTTTYVLHGQIFMVVNTLQWINRSKVLTSLLKSDSISNEEVQQSLADIDLDEIAHLHWYGVAIVSYFRIEQQLQNRGLPFSHTTSLPPMALDQVVSGKVRMDAPVTKVASKIPAICIRSADALGPSSALVKPNMFVRLSKWWDRAACSAQIVVRLSLRSASMMTKLEPPGGGGTIEYDAASRQLTFSTADIDNCITWFLVEWDRFARIGMLVKAVERARAFPGGRARGWKVTNFNFFQASFSYAHGRYATVTWSRSVPGHAVPESYLLRMYADRPKKGADQGKAMQVDDEDADAGQNPHECVEAALEQNLNVGSSYSPGFWPSFLCLLHETLPVLEILRDACKDELSDANAPTLELRSACWYRLTYGSRHALDVRYLTGSRFIIADAARPLFGASLSEAASGFACLPAFHRTTKEAVASYYTLAKQFAASNGVATKGSKLASVEAPDGNPQTSTELQQGTNRLAPSPAAVDLRRAVLCAADEAVVGPILSAVLASVREQLKIAAAGAAVDVEAVPAAVGVATS
ncbi:unnamed protein product [Tilletia controversa]|uniref:Mediator of RNA polymerase II transcription subunit 14 n=3 Tax=Tilletia TaxID=13289 RepID=A0A8X7MVP8_9BASI|nr:hypothetical protein CF335_g6943 [Tilletia laevis]KAE8198610.1 hypothetical protein CF328_g3499 [Tilletia controversa]KAE8261485.1 hypothetical protein A4X03_0g3218 [Tilletia caries]KAE8193774.1 hypothetical protein CF336_g3840 [Tilletia laevis]KAE8249409.1 hypothetical protein A4X06_0g3247 [Tilletia controversa]